MTSFRTVRPRAGTTTRRLVAVTAATLLLAMASGCSSDTSTDDEATTEESTDSGTSTDESTDESKPTDDRESADAGEGADDLLGPADEASGDPVKIGLVSDGATQAFDNTDELRAGEATVEYLNAHKGGIGGRPIELVTCETKADPAGATDCANQMVEEGVVAVTLSQSAVAESVWQPLHDAGVPTFFFAGNGQAILGDTESTFNIINPLGAGFGVPLSVAKDTGSDRIAFVTIDVPAALAGFEAATPVLDAAGVEYDLIKIPVGAADVTPQMQQVVASGAGVVHIVGNDALCIAALQGLQAVGYDGAITSVLQCFTDATREAIDGAQLEGINVTAMVAAGAADDPTYQLYKAVMDAYGPDIETVETSGTMQAYTIVAALATALDGISGDDISAGTVIETIKGMPAQDLPGGGGSSFQCGGSTMPTMPSVCSNDFLRVTLDGEGLPSSYEVIDALDVLQ